MKVGAENRTKLIAAVCLGIVAVALLVSQLPAWFSGASSSAATPVAPATSGLSDTAPKPKKLKRGVPTTAKKDNSARSLDPSLRLDLLKSSEDTKYEGTGRNIFRVFVEPPPKPVAPVVTGKAETQPQQYVPPPPPPIPLSFYGFATPTGGTKRIFLAHGEDVFIAKEGDIVDRRYKIVRISQNAVEVLDVLSNNRQSIPLTQS